YEEALDAFRATIADQPDFLLGYWGEAMAHNHPVWQEQDTEAGRAVLQRVPEPVTATPRERALFDAVAVLYGEGDKPARDRAYAEAMERLWHTNPDDIEIGTFYALALLGTVRDEAKDLRTRMRAGAIALKAYYQHPQHPGAAHYTIHAFDDPDHAILALDAARRYAAIAPAVPHALHMPAHIFVQLGLWAEAAEANQAGWTASLDWVARKDLPGYLRDYHSLHWLHYVLLQQGRVREAEAILKRKQADMRAAIEQETAEPPRPGWAVNRFYPQMAAAIVIETGGWDAASAWFDDVPGAPEDAWSQAVAAFTRAMAAARQGSSAIDWHLEDLRRLGEQADEQDEFRRTVVRIWELEARAASRMVLGEPDEAMPLMQQAVDLVETLPPPSGPPATIKPPHELFGELLLEAGRLREARQTFDVALVRHPNRAAALLGAARTADRLGQREHALARYRQLLDQWGPADPALPAVQEARRAINLAP
ncbi:MAG: hypothetical protein ACREI3_05890, partial [Nitrospirales bacterium]